MKDPMIRVPIVAALVCGVLSAQSWNWTLRITAAVNNPPERSYFAMAHDSSRGATVLFGGFAPSISDDTWEYDGSVWTQITTAVRPPARRAHAMVYDIARGRIVLFGGQRLSWLDDTWEFDGLTWTQISTATTPPGRSFSAFAYDWVRSRFVVFGGYLGTAGGRTNETWEYDGVDWQQVTSPTAPSPRMGVRMVFDSARNRIVLFGGATGNGFSDETWEFDGVAWAQVTTANSPSPRHTHAMVFDVARNRTVVTGGAGAAGPDLDTWEFDGVNWTLATPAVSLPTLLAHEMDYDLTRGRILMFGGNGSTGTLNNNTWEHRTGQVATSTAFGMGCGAAPLGLLQDTLLRPVLGEVVRTEIVNSPTSLTAITMGFDNQTVNGQPLPLDLSSIGMPGCMLYHSAETVGLAAISNVITLTFAVQLPAQPSLIGIDIFVQAYAFAPGANALGAVTSNALHWVLGDI